MNLAEAFERLVKAVEAVCERIEALVKAVEARRTSSDRAGTTQAFSDAPHLTLAGSLGPAAPNGGRLWEISVAAAMREHTAVTGQ